MSIVRAVEPRMRPVVCALVAGLVTVGGAASAHEPSFQPPQPFDLSGGIGDAKPGRALPSYATSSRIASIEGGALVIDADSGWLIRTDLAGAPLAHVAIGIDAGTLVYDPIAKLAYVADRRGDRIVVVKVGKELETVRFWTTPAEPYGVALTPDRSTLLAATIADRTLVAYDVATGKERWRSPLDAEPRGLSIAADGAHVAVALLDAAMLDEIDLKQHKLVRLALAPRGAFEDLRGAFAVTYLGEHLTATALQLERPAADNRVPEHYGGGGFPPISHGIAFVTDRGAAVTAVTNINEPRAVAWDAGRDMIYVVGMATDSILQIAHGSQVDVHQGLTGSLGARCGADGLAIDPEGNVLVWCSFPRSVVKVTVGDKLDATQGPELVASNLDAKRHLGLVMFHTADFNVSFAGGVSCGNCHLDGRSDGVSWLIHEQRLQTPMLAGRLVGTAPYKWDGGAKDLPTSLRATIDRLGGNGLSQKHIAALTAYLEVMPAVRTPTRDHAAVARGKALFDSAELGCTQCHDGPMLTDRQRHKFNGTTFDTPSLVGLAASAPYFHDGSAPTLDTLLRDHGTVHGMEGSATGVLSDAQRADVVAYLETL